MNCDDKETYEAQALDAIVGKTVSGFTYLCGEAVELVFTDGTRLKVSETQQAGQIAVSIKE